MKVLIFGKAAQNIEPLVKKSGFEIVTADPDMVVSFGGDGTLLSSERKYPSIPKLPIRNSDLCHKCSDHEDNKLLERLLAGKLKLKSYQKLQTNLYGKELLALNDFVVRNSDPTHTIRFKVTSEAGRRRAEGPINNQLLIGDGIVIATSFGSTGYFKSITGEGFDSGFGLAFNNITQKLPPIFLKDDQMINFKLVRGKTTLSFDNNPDIFVIDEESELNFKLSDHVAKIYEPTSLRCPNCQITRG